MTHRSRQSPPDAGTRRAVSLAAILSVLATAVSVGALALVLARGTGTDTGRAGQPSPSACGTVAWSALPGADALPSGWAIASTRFLVGLVTTTIVGPAPSGSAQGPVVFVSVTCHGSDAGQALALDRAAARVSGDADAAFPKLGDESFAVTSTRTSSLAVHVRRGILVADVDAAISVDQATVEAVARAVDDAMALARNPPPSPAPAASGSTAASPSPASPAPSTSSGQSPSPSPSATPASHVIPDLEARLPKTVDGTAMAIDSVTGGTALGTDATSQALIASLAKLGKTSADLEIGRARDPTGSRTIRLYAFRVEGVGSADLVRAIVGAFRADATSSPSESQVTLAGRTLTKVSYSQGPAEYLIEAAGGVVFNIETTDESLVAKLLPLLK